MAAAVVGAERRGSARRWGGRRRTRRSGRCPSPMLKTMSLDPFSPMEGICKSTSGTEMPCGRRDAAVDHAAHDVRAALDLLDVQRDQAVVDQDSVAGCTSSTIRG